MKKIGITGQSGFIGYHLYNHIKLLSDKYKIIEFKKEYFDSLNNLVEFVSECDTIIHLAAINRHDDEDFIYNENISLAKKIVEALKKTNNKPQIIFSSSIQENHDTIYGLSKKMAREILSNWANTKITLNPSTVWVIIPFTYRTFIFWYKSTIYITF